MAPTAAFLSYRFGGEDGVSIEAGKWAWALGQLGFSVRSVAGEIRSGGGSAADDVVVPALAITPPAGANISAGEVHAAIDGADLVVVENLCSLPLNVDAARACAEALQSFRGRVVFRHHDLAWQRRTLQHLEHEFPPHLDGALHVTINLRSRRELTARGYAHVVAIPNRFDLDAPHGNREATRARLGVADDELLLYQPARAIERKNVPGGLKFAARLAALVPERPLRYWLTGPAEDGYEATLARVLERSPVPVVTGRAPTLADGYAAADVVMLPSTWEGFGNPTIESVWARRPLAVYPYPVLSEIVTCGLQFFALDQPDTLARFLRAPDEKLFDVNLRRARLSFALDTLPAAIDAAFSGMGWTAW